MTSRLSLQEPSQAVREFISLVRAMVAKETDNNADLDQVILYAGRICGRALDDLNRIATALEEIASNIYNK